MKEQNMRFGKFIKTRRLADPRELTLKDVSEHLGMSLTLLSDIENGRRRPFDSVKIEEYCAYLGLPEADKALIRGYYGCEALPEDRMNEVFVRSALMCRAETAVVSLQDWLGLGSEARINDPSHQPDNWHWRLPENCYTSELAADIFELTRRYGRLNWDSDYVRAAMEA